MFRSATFKLTLWYLGLVMVISLVFSGVVYEVGSNELSRGLRRQTEGISSNFPVFDNSPFLRSGGYIQNGEHRLLERLIIFNLVVLVGAGAASYALARWTLEPIEQAHEQQKRFTADVSHELRTPLTALKMESEVALMDAGASKEALRQALASNLEEVGKLDALINNLLRLTRLEANELQHSFVSLDIAEIVSQAIQQVDKIAASRSITIQNDVTSARTLGDAESLTQLVVILLDNAIKYSPDNSRITLSSKHTDHHLGISVKDQGSGIAKADLEKVFDRFYRADASRTKAGSEGFGLGLSIAKLIADVHRATISLASRPGHGTTATIELPIATN